MSNVPGPNQPISNMNNVPQDGFVSRFGGGNGEEPVYMVTRVCECCVSWKKILRYYQQSIENHQTSSGPAPVFPQNFVLPCHKPKTYQIDCPEEMRTVGDRNGFVSFKVRERYGFEQEFRVKTETPMISVKQAFTAFYNAEKNVNKRFSFVYNWATVRDDDTPASLRLLRPATIDAREEEPTVTE